MQIKINAAAKINLLLDLTSILENGYHSIYTVMQTVGIYDTVEVNDNDSGNITISCSSSRIPTDKKNTAYKAAAAFFEYTGIKNKGVDIKIEKVIPSQAGMAGGSADAAAAIKAMNTLFNTELSDKQLCEIALKIGSDVPFCLLGGTRLCLNTGEVMAELPDLPECKIIVVKPRQSVSTQKAYDDFDTSEWIRHPDNDGFLFAAVRRDLKGMCQKAANVFEQAVEVTDRVKVKSIMRNNNAMLSMMTGSGAAIFGIFKNDSDIKHCLDELGTNYDDVFVTEPVNNGLFEL